MNAKQESKFKERLSRLSDHFSYKKPQSKVVHGQLPQEIPCKPESQVVHDITDVKQEPICDPNEDSVMLDETILQDFQDPGTPDPYEVDEYEVPEPTLELKSNFGIQLANKIKEEMKEQKYQHDTIVQFLLEHHQDEIAMAGIKSESNKNQYSLSIMLDPSIFLDYCPELGNDLLIGKLPTEDFAEAALSILSAQSNTTLRRHNLYLTLGLTHLPFYPCTNIPAEFKSPHDLCHLIAQVTKVEPVKWKKWVKAYRCNGKCRNRNTLKVYGIREKDHAADFELLNKYCEEGMQMEKYDEFGKFLASFRGKGSPVEKLCEHCGKMMEEDKEANFYIREQALRVRDITKCFGAEHLFSREIFALFEEELTGKFNVGDIIELIGRTERELATYNLRMCVLNAKILKMNLQSPNEFIYNREESLYGAGFSSPIPLILKNMVKRGIIPFEFSQRLVDDFGRTIGIPPNAYRKLKLALLLCLVSVSTSSKTSKNVNLNLLIAGNTSISPIVKRILHFGISLKRNETWIPCDKKGSINRLQENAIHNSNGGVLHLRHLEQLTKGQTAELRKVLSPPKLIFQKRHESIQELKPVFSTVAYMECTVNKDWLNKILFANGLFDFVVYLKESPSREFDDYLSSYILEHELAPNQMFGEMDCEDSEEITESEFRWLLNVGCDIDVTISTECENMLKSYYYVTRRLSQNADFDTKVGTMEVLVKIAVNHAKVQDCAVVDDALVSISMVEETVAAKTMQRSLFNFELLGNDQENIYKLGGFHDEECVPDTQQDVLGEDDWMKDYINEIPKVKILKSERSRVFNRFYEYVNGFLSRYNCKE
ncbi:hypothetical protein HK098_006823 [Nowakowskiella sp. JEL0407]|nr:hypothetical protein HK098_006823 [Nowakowskiella sp. JEL0407]